MSSQDIQYVAKRDAAGTWRILDTWDESLSSIADDEEISDSNPSVTVLTEGQYLAVVREATKGGYLQSAALAELQFLEARVEELEADNIVLGRENESLGEQLLDTDTVQDMASPRSNIQQPTPSSDLSESFLIKQMIIAKLANMGQAENMIGLND
jgi:hypothetical protein|tara:strand:- start:1527 stop:1991 length:465 start_codon:yes stop_codon:yes gene_type:complete